MAYLSLPAALWHWHVQEPSLQAQQEDRLHSSDFLFMPRFNNKNRTIASFVEAPIYGF
jgi:hypothetical protein